MLAKWLVGLLALVGLAVGALAIFVTQVDPNDYREQIRTVIQDATGFDVKIGGDLALSNFPRMHLSAHDISVHNGKHLLAHLGAVDIHLNLLALLRREIQSSGIAIRRATVTLTRDKHGLGNWVIASSRPRPGKDAKDAPMTAAPVLGGIALGGLAVEDSHFIWKDEASKQTLSVSVASLTTGEITPGQTATLSLTGALSEQPNGLGADFDLHFATFAKSLEQITLSEIQSKFRPHNKTRRALPEITLAGDLTLTNSTIHLTTVTLRASEAVVKIAGDWSPSRASLHATSNRFDGQALLRDFGVPTQFADGVLDDTEIQADILVNGVTVEMKNLSAKVGESQFVGWTRGILNALPTIQTSLAVNRIRLDAYLPQTASPSSAQPTANKKHHAPAAALGALGALAQDQFVATLNLQVGTLSFKKKTLNNLRLVAVSGKKKLNIISASAKAFGGEVSANLQLDATRPAVRLRTAGLAKTVRLKDVLEISGADADDIDERGRLSSNFQLRTTGANPDRLLAALVGSVKLSVSDASLAHHDLLKSLLSVAEFLTPRTSRHTSLRVNATADIRIDRGVLRNKNLSGDFGPIVFTGKGSLDLKDQRVRYTLSAGLPDKKHKARTNVPIKITGRLSDLRTHVDFNSIIRNEIEKEIHSLDKTIEKPLRKLFRGLGKQLLK